ncbi:MAG TPA: UbiA family prenyltransferase [Candidatus Nitrosocosmicus sp.]|nr:UbiA family prenyltransferase [Candidatus Nitrosocosmicus sp.]
MLDNPYLKLLRIPNIFTIPPDIVLGILIALSSIQVSMQSTTSFYQLSPLLLFLPNIVILIFSSISLYLGGLVSNDLFDTKIDKIERPNRPLPSGNIDRKYAIILLIFFFTAGFLLALLFFNIVTAGISGLLIITILVYNYKLKNGILRPFIMGGIRALNVLYGFSIIFNFSKPLSDVTLFDLGLWSRVGTNLWSGVETQSLVLLCLATSSVFFHVFVLTFVSSRETIREFASNSKKPINLKKLLYSYIAFLFIIGAFGTFFVDYPLAYIFFLFALGVIVILIFYQALLRKRPTEASLKMQYIVKNMIILLILLDSVFIAGVAGPLIGLMTAFLILPSILLSKKINMT